MSKRRLHVVTNTHWDSEHRHGFQETRFMLVEMIDKLVDIMEADPEFKYFTFDGQVGVLDDYLEIKPHMKTRLQKLIKAGRILVGPWYSLVDHFSINPESIVRNLLVGDRCCRQFGNKMKFGYSIFSFGQMAQLPQVYAGFGIDNLITYKRCAPEIFKQSEFLWSAPDGSKVLGSRLGAYNRINFLFCFTIPVLLGGDARKPGWEVKFVDGTRLTHLIDNTFYTQHATECEPDIRIRKEKIQQAVQDTLDSVSDSASKSVFLAFDGIDFSSPLKELPAALKEANAIAGDDVEIIHSNPVDYFRELRNDIDLNSLFAYTGEMRFGPLGRIHCESLGANVELKQRNYKAEMAMLNYAEPFSIFHKLNGGTYPFHMLAKAWQYLFKVHAHDSIHGTGVPKIKTDNLCRLDQVQEMADGITRRAFEGIASQIGTSSFDDDDILITIFNPSQVDRSEVIDIKIDLPREEFVKEYHLEDLDGQRIQIYEYGRKNLNIASINAENRPKSVCCERIDAAIFVENVPSLGYKTLKLKRESGKHHERSSAFPNPIFPFNPIGKLPNVLENGILKVEINQNGTLNITDLQSGFVAKGLHVFVDTACSGDMWIHRQPQDNQTLTSFANNASITLVRNSCLAGSFKIDVTLNIPESLEQNRMSRSKHTIQTIISTEIILSKMSRRIDFKTCVTNNCKDHKLTVSFPSSIKTDQVFCENPFEIRHRPVQNYSNNNGRIGDELLRHPMHGFVDISDGNVGISLLAKGIKEFESKYYDGKFVACDLTLLRSVTQAFPVHEDVFLEFENEQSQCIGAHVFEYSLFFHKGDYLEGYVISESRNYSMPCVAVEYGKGKKGILPPTLSFLKSNDRSVIINCIKRAEDSDDVVVRLTNPTGKHTKNRLEFYNKIKNAFGTTLNEERIQAITIIDGNKLDIDLPPYKIVTICLTM